MMIRHIEHDGHPGHYGHCDHRGHGCQPLGTGWHCMALVVGTGGHCRPRGNS